MLFHVQREGVPGLVQGLQRSVRIRPVSHSRCLRDRITHFGEQALALRNTAIGLLRAQGETNIARGLRHCANQPRRVLRVLGLAP